jgi:hypothetical protein
MPFYTVVLKKDGVELPVGLRSGFRYAVGDPQFEAELLMAFSSGIPESGSGWTHMAVYDGLMAGKKPVAPELAPAQIFTKRDIEKMQGAHRIRFDLN